jgi:hypothetical protein
MARYARLLGAVLVSCCVDCVLTILTRAGHFQFSFRLRRYCAPPSGGSNNVVETSSFVGISFPGSAVGAVSYFSLTPSQVSASEECDTNAVCSGGQCTCIPGYIGTGLSCTPCLGTGVCGSNIACPGGNTCGTTCNSGFAYDAIQRACVPRVQTAVTVYRAQPTTAGCVGSQLGTFGVSAPTCNAACQQGPTSGSTFCGTSLGVPTFCCFRPTFQWISATNPSVNPTNVQAYPLFSMPVIAPSVAPNVCLASVNFVSADVGTGCAVSQFQIGFLDDSSWTSTITWNQAQALTLLDSFNFEASSLTAFVPTPANLDKISANLRANNGRLSFFIRRWCNASSLTYSNAAFDDNAFVNNNFGLTNLASQTCDPNASCVGATCVCNTNYYGDGLTCQPVTCTNNVVPGFFFDATEVVLSGQNAVTTTCAVGLVGSASRLCVWNGPSSPTGTFANPINNCVPVVCPTLSALNATFSSVLIGSSAGACLTGFAGTISATCTLNATTGNTANFDDFTGACSRTCLLPMARTHALRLGAVHAH